MGLFWDLIQQNQISEQQKRSTSIEDRVRQLELQVQQMRQIQQELLLRLESHLGEDIDKDGKIGR